MPHRGTLTTMPCLTLCGFVGKLCWRRRQHFCELKDVTMHNISCLKIQACLRSRSVGNMASICEACHCLALSSCTCYLADSLHSFPTAMRGSRNFNWSGIPPIWPGDIFRGPNSRFSNPEITSKPLMAEATSGNTSHLCERSLPSY